MSLYVKMKAAIKQNQFIYAGYKLASSKELKHNVWNAKHALKSKQQIFNELRLLRDYWGCIPLHYFRYGLYDKNLSLEELKDYIPPYFFYVKYNEKLFKGIDCKFFDNKLNLYYEFKKRGIQTIPVLAFFDPKTQAFYNPDTKEIIEERNLLSLLSENDKFFVKPVDGQGGNGIIVLKREAGVVVCNGRTVYKLSSLLGKTTYVIQRGLVQREDVMHINPSSVNTLRIITKWIDGQPLAKVCVMRIGRDGKDIDNSAQGGLSVQIDVNNGNFYPIATAEHGGGAILRHPDTGFYFKGASLLGWNAFREQIETYASLIPELPEIGWDVAVTKEGIRIIELNTGFGIDHLQCCCGGLRRKLEIFPKKY